MNKIVYEIYIYIFKAQEVEETMKRIQSHKGVVGTIVVNAEGTWENLNDLFVKKLIKLYLF